MECYVGLDVHSKASVFVIQDGHGQVLAQGEMLTTPEGLRRRYDAQHLPAGTPVARETGTVAFFVARELTALGCTPSVIDAREVRLKAHRPTRRVTGEMPLSSATDCGAGSIAPSCTCRRPRSPACARRWRAAGTSCASSC